MRTGKVIGFDSWMRGAHHFERLVSAFGRLGLSVELVHLGSWGNDPGRRQEETVGELVARDISTYENSIPAVLAHERPSAAILLSTETFAHRAIVRYCRRLGIPTLLLYHGLVNVQVTSDARGSYRIDRLAYARFVVGKLGKIASKTLPCYLRALVATQAGWRDWRRLAVDTWRLAVGRRALVAAPDARTTMCAVYTHADVEHARRTYGFGANEIVEVGNPDLSRFGLRSELIGSRVRGPSAGARTIVYIDTGLPSVGLIFKSRDAYIRHLAATREELFRQGWSLQFKAHPAHDLKFLREALHRIDVGFVPDDGFMSALNECAACMVETTTLAMVPALLGIPLLLARYDELHALRFGPVLKSYPRAFELTRLADVTNYLAPTRFAQDISAVKEWISANSGPLPAEEMPHRVAHVVQAMIQRKRARPESSE